MKFSFAGSLKIMPASIYIMTPFFRIAKPDLNKISGLLSLKFLFDTLIILKKF